MLLPIGRLKVSCPRSFLLFSLLLLVVPGPAIAFLGRGTLLEPEGDIFRIYCPEFDRGIKVWHHQDITREAVRRVVDRYFQDVAPAEGKYSPRPNVTLEEAYFEYYGDGYSSKPFLDAVSTLVDAVAEADTGILGADPRYHFGNERFSESQENLKGRWRRIFKASQAGDYTTALYLLGLSLSTIQDFYSNTNWVELGNTDFNRDIGKIGKNLTNVADYDEGTCKDCPDAAEGVGSCSDNLLQEILDGKKLTSGYTEDAYVDGVRTGKPRGVNKCSHGGPRDRSQWTGARGGINKELPTSCFSPHHQLHYQAAEQAVRASEYYLNHLRSSLGDAIFSRLLALHPNPGLVIVLDTTDSMDEELDALTHSVKRLVQQHASALYPPAEYILVPFNGPLYGPVTRSQEPEEIYSALSQLRATGGGDEAELSMSTLRLALHYAPPHSQVYLITDASIKDPELFHTVVTLAVSKNIKVTPMLTMPVREGGTHDKLRLNEEVFQHGNLDKNNFRLIRSSVKRRQKRQSFDKYSELARRTGGQVIQTESDQTERMSKILESKHNPMAILWRKAQVNSPQRVSFPVDSSVKELDVSISGQVVSAWLVSPKGVKLDLLAQGDYQDYQGYSVVALTPYITQVRINMNQHQDELGDWTLTFDPIRVSSAIVSAQTIMDVLPAFYKADAISNSLQRTVGQPTRGLDTYLDVFVTGLDTAGSRRVESAHLVDASGREVTTLNIPSKAASHGAYVRLPSRFLPQGRFTVAVDGVDESGRRFRRESFNEWETVDSSLAFPLGRDIWGPPGSTLSIPIEITNTNEEAPSTTYSVEAHNSLGSPVRLNQTRVKVERNKTAPLKATMELDSQALPDTTNTLVVTATSTRGDTSQAQAYVSVTPRIDDTTNPTCEFFDAESCSGYLGDTCSSRDWSVVVIAKDSGLGLFNVVSNPPYVFNNFATGSNSVNLRYKNDCCKPSVSIKVTDVAGNIGRCSISVADVGNANLKAGEVAGIAVGSILGIALIILIVGLIVLYRRRHRNENVTPTRSRRRSSFD